MKMNLLDLPSEVRYAIWEFVFADNDITPENPSNIVNSSCSACINITRPLSHQEYYKPALVSKQICQDSRTFLKTFTLHTAKSQTLKQIYKLSVERRSEVLDLVLYLHLDEENRMEWLIVLDKLERHLPKLRSLIIHNHMRPPTSYQNLMDGVFLAAPLVKLRSSIEQTLHFDYIMEDVMFSSPFLGEIRCSDALEEHELVIQDLLQDTAFKAGACAHDINRMTAALVRIARSHEQPWFEKMQTKRLQELARNAPSSSA